MLYKSYHYSQWDGTQHIFELDADALMDQLSEEVLKQGDLMRAMREMFRQGFQDREGRQMPGMRDLIEQLKNRRRQQLQQYNMDSVVDDFKEKLDEILQTERSGIDRRLDEAQQQVQNSHAEDQEQHRHLTDLLEQRAQRNRKKLDDLPEGMGGQIKELMEYDFMDPQAQQMFQELLEMLKGQMAQNLSQQMQEQMQGMSPEQMAATRDMLHQLSQMMRDKMKGNEPAFEGFMQQFGAMFGSNPPQSFDELMERLQQQMAQMQSMMESMSPEMRQELEDAMSAALDSATRAAMSEFASMMEIMMPMDELRRQYPFLGDDSLTMDQAMDLMRQLQENDQLEQALQEAMRTGNLEGIEPDKLAELLGDDAKRVWEPVSYTHLTLPTN